ncbi:MAG: hypothetical protein C4535_02565 [Comamonadaceae bacterium]|nr:MAG: hypothetical protein C4535_02565 [Comamonadaceae bacterium]
MSLLGSACLAMWWDMAADMRPEFEHWHSHEHFPERLALPGFRRASRWTSATGGEGVFVMYELESWAMLSSPAYLASLNAPSPWSTKLMPHHRHMVRSQCHVLESRGAAVARQALTLRLSPAGGRDADLLHALKTRAADLVALPGLAGVHLLRHQAPAIAETTEQKIRGGADQGADWVLVVCGYEAAVLDALAQGPLNEDALVALGARPGVVGGRYALSLSGTPGDMR